MADNIYYVNCSSAASPLAVKEHETSGINYGILDMIARNNEYLTFDIRAYGW
jgi:hypothetical protein